MRPWIAPLAAAALLGGPVPAWAAASGRVDVRAAHVEMYIYPLALRARGGVVVRIGGRTISADEITYDLNKNHLIARGDVRVANGTGTLDAIAYALDVPQDDATLVRVGNLPATYHVRGGDAGVPREGPPEAGTFATPDFSSSRPYLRGPHAVLTPNVGVRFTPVRVATEAGGAYVPSPTFLYAFATNPSFTAQALPGATFDQPYNIVGSAHSLLAAHVRYDTVAGATVGFDEHLVAGTKAYAVGSVLPFVSRGRFDLNAFEQLTSTLTQQLQGTHFAGNDYAQYQLALNARKSTTSLVLQQSGGTQTDDLRIRSVFRQLGRLFNYQLTAGVGYDRSPGMLPYNADFRTTLEAYLETPSLHGPFRTTLQPSVDFATSIYNFPRQRGSQTYRVAVSRSVSPALSFFGYAQIVQNYDRYRDNLRFFYPAAPITLPDGTTYFGYAAYAGTGTQRSYSLSATYQPNPAFNLVLAYTHERDFPQFDGYGAPPYSLSFDVRVRPARLPAFEFGRTYVFGWGGRAFAPYYTLGISP
ncbi:MAG: hypothetical protein ABI346_05655 [Candidatus Baltobacteraceae bacterium]